MAKSDASPPKDDEVVINGKKYCQVQSHCIYYLVSSHKSRRVGSLVDRGAMVALLVTMFVSLRNLIEQSMSEVLTITRLPIFPS